LTYAADKRKRKSLSTRKNVWILCKAQVTNNNIRNSVFD